MTENLCSMQGIIKNFVGVRALKSVDFDLRAGEIHALLGENGAGKSTLMKILSGSYPQDEGEIRINGKPVILKSPFHSRQLGISIVHQEPQMAASLSIAENICLGSWPQKLGIVSWKKMLEESKVISEQIGLKKPMMTKVEELNMAEKQMVQIARALKLASKVLILDEPTSSLTPQEKKALFSIIADIKNQGMGLIYISHRMEEIFEIADRVTVLKDGQLVKTLPVNEVDSQSLIQMMVGREMGKLYPPKADNFGSDLLVVDRIERKGVFANMSFKLRRGEVLGFAGLVGSGRSEVALSLFGADPIDNGTVTLNGEKMTVRNTADAIRKGIALVGEDRNEGMVHVLSVRENMILPSLSNLSKWGIVKPKEQKVLAKKYIEQLKIKTPHEEQPIGALSGGNQQKVIFARWLMKQANVFILDEPTRGIDVGAKEEIYQLVRKLTAEGKGVILISSELPELLGMSDRILVMRNGTIAGILESHEATEESITQLAMGVV